MLYLVSTPIGNLGDISYRAIETLKKCDYILCEDTRTSLPLLKHFEITTQRKSYHKFNEFEEIEKILNDLKNGKQVALISDAGTPLISDPGEELVKRCQMENISVRAIPGPVAAIAALTVSGLNSSRFQFLGFLPKKKGDLKERLKEALEYKGTTIFYESPKRIQSTLKLILELSPERSLALVREITKKFEQHLVGTAQGILDNLTTLKGEMVLLISESKGSTPSQTTLLSIQDHVEMIQERDQVPLKEAIKLAAKERGIPKRDVYKEIHFPDDPD